MTSHKTEEFRGKLVDFDWQIRHVMGSNTCRNLENSLTQVSFLANDQSNSIVRNVSVEFTKTELKQLISTLQSSREHTLVTELKMGLAELDEMFKKHQRLCSDLNMDKESSKTSWNNYLQTKHNYTLEGNQLHWMACAIYVACRKSSVPAVGRMNTYIEGNLVSLTRLLRLCDLTLLHFIDKCRKWANMVGLTNDFKNKITALERKFAVSTVVFKKFRSIFDDMFENQEENGAADPDKMKVYKKGKGITCTNSRLMEFTWTLYLVVKSEFPDISEDLVSSYHLLLACCDLIYGNTVCSDRRDILNRNFVGIPEHFFDDDYDPPSDPICIIDELCKIHEGIAIDAKSVREYSWKPQIKKLFERGILDGDASRFTEILHGEVFDSNYRSVNKAYEQYVLSVGDFDERVMLIESQNEAGDAAADDEPQADTDNVGSGEDVERPPSIIHPNTLTPLTGRQYLKNRDGAVSVGSVTPMTTAKECVIRLHTMLKGAHTPLRQSLEAGGVDEKAIGEIDAEIRRKVAEMMARCQPTGEGQRCENNDAEPPAKYSEFTRARLEVAERLFYKMLDDIAHEEVKMGKPDVGESLRQDLFLRSLFACAVEITVFSYGSPQFNFPWILDALRLPAYHFYKIIELVVRTENQLSRDMVKHLNMLEERILDSMSWTSDSPLWRTIEESNMPVPVCEEVCLPHQLSTLNGGVQRGETLSSYATAAPTAKNAAKTDPKSTKSKGKDTEGGGGDGKTKPKRGGSLGLFFRKFYHLASVRMQDLCQQLNISSEEVRLKIWTCFEHVIVSTVELMTNRHLDQILMCTVYVACKVLEIDLTFQEIMKCYRTQPQSASHIYRDVLLTTVGGDSDANRSSAVEERGDLIKFYNSVYVKVIQNFALKFSSKSSAKSEPLMLSPLPVSRSKKNSPFRRLSDKHSIFIRCLDNTDNISPSPQKPMSYYFSRSPAKDLHAINNMMQINSVKRSLNTGDEEEPTMKKFAPRTDTSKLQDLLEDRRTYKL